MSVSLNLGNSIKIRFYREKFRSLTYIGPAFLSTKISFYWLFLIEGDKRRRFSLIYVDAGKEKKTHRQNVEWADKRIRK